MDNQNIFKFTDATGQVSIGNELAVVCAEDGIDLTLPSHDLIVTDCNTVEIISTFLDRHSDELSYCRGKSVGCYFRARDVYRFAWQLQLCKSEKSSCCGSVASSTRAAMYWYQLPQHFTEVLQSYAKFKSWHYAYCDAMIATTLSHEWTAISNSCRKVHLVMGSAEDVQFYGKVCPSMMFSRVEGVLWTIKTPIKSYSMGMTMDCLLPVYHGAQVENVLSIKQYHCSRQRVTHTVLTLTHPASSIEHDLDICETFDQKIAFKCEQVEPEKTEVLPAPSRRRKSSMVKANTYAGLIDIATTYAKFFPKTKYDFSACPIPVFSYNLPPIILECPICLCPRRASSSSSFLNLLHHLQKKHPQSVHALAEDVSKTYSGFVEMMKAKVARIQQKLYKMKLRARMANLKCVS